MRHGIFLLLFLAASFAAFSQSNLQQSVSINSDGSLPHASALLDVQSTVKGILVPRMETGERTAIASPAPGLLVYDIDKYGFWYYNGTTWVGLAVPKTLADTDGDTKIQVEESANEDVIRFDLGGTEKMVLRKNASGAARLELPDLCYNTFVGQEAGLNNWSGASCASENSFFGFHAGKENTFGYSNTFLGNQAGRNNQTGSNNTAIGKDALVSNTGGSYNTATGVSALYFNTTGFDNTATGNSALSSNITGNNNTATGAFSLQYNTTGFNNTANGAGALSYNSTGNANTANGRGSLFSNQTGSHNSATGTSTLNANTTGSYNTATGSLASLSNATGSYNTATGYSALNFNTGTANTATGALALNFNTSGGSNTSNGTQALYSNTIGNNNTATGVSALNFNTEGADNTANGSLALYSNTTGIRNTAIGSQADVTSGNLTNATAIGYNAKVACSNCMVLGGTGADAVSVGIGVTTVPAGIKLQVEGNVGLPTGSSVYVGGVTDSGADGLRLHHAAGSAYIDHKGSGNIHFRADNGNGGTIRMRIKSNGNVGIGRDPVTNIFEVEGDASKSSAGDWLANSDARLKKNILPLNSEETLQKMLSLRGVTYEWNDDKTGSARPEGIQYGFTAQNIREAFPTLVEEDALGYLQTPYGTYDAMTVEAMRALNDKITGQQAIIETQAKALRLLETQVARLLKITASLENAGASADR